MKRRLIDIETSRAMRCLAKKPASRVFVFVNEDHWALPSTSKHEIYYGTENKTRPLPEFSIIASLEALPVLPESIDFLILPHVLTKNYDLDDLMRSIDIALKPNGEVLIFGANQSSQYSSDKIKCELRRGSYRVLKHRAYHVLPFLGLELGGVFDYCLGQFMPKFSNTYYVLAKKQRLSAKPLRITPWRWHPTLATRKVRPLAGRSS